MTGRSKWPGGSVKPPALLAALQFGLGSTACRFQPALSAGLRDRLSLCPACSGSPGPGAARSEQTYSVGSDFACPGPSLRTPATMPSSSAMAALTSLCPVFGALTWLSESTERLTASVEQMRPEDLAQPSHLPGWSRAHVLVHLSRNADGLRNLLLSARTGEPLRMYPSPGAREADISAGVTRPAEVVLADAVEASRRFLVEVHSFPESCWPNEVAFTSGGPNPPLVSAERIVELRLTEVEIHHVDLDLVYSFADVPVLLAGQLLVDFVERYDRKGAHFALELDDSPGGVGWVKSGDLPVVRGSLAAALAWLTGRSSEGMRCTSGGPLPDLPPFG